MSKKEIRMTKKELQTLAENLETELKEGFEKPKGADVICKECKEEIAEATKIRLHKLSLNDGDLVVVKLSPKFYNDFASIVTTQITNALTYSKKRRVSVITVPDTDDYTILGKDHQVINLLKRYGFEYTGHNPMRDGKPMLVIPQ